MPIHAVDFSTLQPPKVANTIYKAAGCEFYFKCNGPGTAWTEIPAPPGGTEIVQVDFTSLYPDHTVYNQFKPIEANIVTTGSLLWSNTTSSWKCKRGG